jgi:hypothetical protein
MRVLRFPKNTGNESGDWFPFAMEIESDKFPFNTPDDKLTWVVVNI